MKFVEVYEALKQGAKVKLPEWAGFWTWEDNSIKMHCKDGRILDIRETENVDYTLNFILRDDWATKLAVKAMLQDGIINKNDVIYEPCCGAGAITDVLEQAGFQNVMASDIQTGEFIKGERGIDVCDISDNVCDVVFTNPPYNRMTKDNMLAEFQRISRKKVILLLNIFFLSSKERKKMLENSHLQHVYIHSDRVTMYPYGEEKPKNGGTKMFAWFIWDIEYKGLPTFNWI